MWGLTVMVFCGLAVLWILGFQLGYNKGHRDGVRWCRGELDRASGREVKVDIIDIPGPSRKLKGRWPKDFIGKPSPLSDAAVHNNELVRKIERAGRRGG